MTVQIKPHQDGPSGLQDFIARLGVLGELLAFLWKRKLYWLLPLVLVLMVFALIIILGGSSPLSPFIYSLF